MSRERRDLHVDQFGGAWRRLSEVGGGQTIMRVRSRSGSAIRRKAMVVENQEGDQDRLTC